MKRANRYIRFVPDRNKAALDGLIRHCIETSKRGDVAKCIKSKGKKLLARKPSRRTSRQK